MISFKRVCKNPLISRLALFRSVNFFLPVLAVLPSLTFLLFLFLLFFFFNFRFVVRAFVLSPRVILSLSSFALSTNNSLSLVAWKCSLELTRVYSKSYTIFSSFSFLLSFARSLRTWITSLIRKRLVCVCVWMCVYVCLCVRECV